MADLFASLPAKVQALYDGAVEGYLTVLGRMRAARRLSTLPLSEVLAELWRYGLLTLEAYRERLEPVGQSHRITELALFGPDETTRLAELGITTIEALLEQGRTPAGRRATRGAAAPRRPGAASGRGRGVDRASGPADASARVLKAPHRTTHARVRRRGLGGSVPQRVGAGVRRRAWRSKRSRLITLFQAATKSFTSFSSASSAA